MSRKMIATAGAGGIVAIGHRDWISDSDLLYRPEVNFDAVNFHSNYDYMRVVQEGVANISLPYEPVNSNCGKKGKDCSAIPRQGIRVHLIYQHNLGYRPAMIGVDNATGRGICGSMFYYSSNNTTFRLGWLAVNEWAVYLREEWLVQYVALDQVDKSFRFYFFNKAAVP